MSNIKQYWKWAAAFVLGVTFLALVNIAESWYEAMRQGGSLPRFPVSKSALQPRLVRERLQNDSLGTTFGMSSPRTLRRATPISLDFGTGRFPCYILLRLNGYGLRSIIRTVLSSKNPLNISRNHAAVDHYGNTGTNRFDKANGTVRGSWAQCLH